MPTESAAKRTNSLGRAADDCWSCQRISRDGTRTKRCDRQRPRCNVCTESGKVCSGYRQEIQWQGGAARANWKVKNTDSPNSPEQGSHETSRRPHRTESRTGSRYEFIREKVEADYVDTSFGYVSARLEGKRARTSSEDPGVAESHERNDPLPHRNVQTRDHDTFRSAIAPRDSGGHSVEARPQFPVPSIPPMRLNRSSSDAQERAAPWTSTSPPFAVPYARGQPVQAHQPQRPHTSFSGTEQGSAHASSYIPTYSALQAARHTTSPYNLTAPTLSQGQRNSVEVTRPEVSGHFGTSSINDHFLPPQSQPRPQQIMRRSPPQEHKETDDERAAEPVRARQSWHEIVGSTRSSQNQTLPATVQSLGASENRTSYSPKISSDNMQQENRPEIPTRRPTIKADSKSRDFTSDELRRLQYFDLVICPMLVTRDEESTINPYREVLRHVSELPTLKEAVLALAAGHAENASLEHNKIDGVEVGGSAAYKTNSDPATREFSQDKDVGEATDGALITLLILILSKALQSGRAEWRVHFKEVASLLEQRGGVPALLASAAVLRAQTAILVWYDMSIALLSRKGCCLPHKYVEALVGCSDTRWSFFNLVGCPGQLCLIIHKLCQFVAQSAVDGAVKDSTSIETFEQELCSYIPDNPEDVLRQSGEKGVDGDLDGEVDGKSDRKLEGEPDDKLEGELDTLHKRLYASEAWRYALRLYVARVLRKRPLKDPRVIVSFARRLIDQAILIRPTSAEMAKLSLPLLLAGAEPVGRQHRADYNQLLQERGKRDIGPVLQSYLSKQSDNGDDDLSIVDHLAGQEWLFV